MAKAKSTTSEQTGEPSKQRQATVQAILAIGDKRAAEELGGRFNDLSGAEQS